MINELDVLRIVVKRLESAGIPYMITGSTAANFYTTPRMTRDIDIVIEVEGENTETLFFLFASDFYIDKDSIRNAIHNRQIFNIIHNEGLVKVDFIIKKKLNIVRSNFSADGVSFSKDWRWILLRQRISYCPSFSGQKKVSRKCRFRM